MDSTRRPHRHDDDTARREAVAALRARFRIAGVPRVEWDPVHHLQGHAVVDGCHVVVIASRDDAHRPLVLSFEDWDELRCRRTAAASS